MRSHPQSNYHTHHPMNINIPYPMVIPWSPYTNLCYKCMYAHVKACTHVYVQNLEVSKEGLFLVFSSKSLPG